MSNKLLGVLLVVVITMNVLMKTSNVTCDRGGNQVLTDLSIELVNMMLDVKDLQMIVATVKSNDTSELLDFAYIITMDSMLFLRPYTRLYTLFTISTKIEFASVYTTVVPNVTRTSDKQLSYWGKVLLNETKASSVRPAKGDISVCTQTEKYEDNPSVYRVYYCWDVVKQSGRTVSASKMLILQDWCLALMQIVMMVGITAYINLKFYHIRRDSMHVYVTDSLSNKPFWQNILPLMTRKMKTNYRFWDSVQLMFVFFLLYVLCVMSSFLPRQWPEKNQEAYKDNLARYIVQNDRRFLLISLCLIGVNLVLCLLKIIGKVTQGKSDQLTMPTGFVFVTAKYIIAAILSLAGSGTLAVFMFIVLPEKYTLMNNILFGIGIVAFGIWLFKNMITKPVYVNSWIYKKYLEKTKFGKLRYANRGATIFPTLIMILFMMGTWISVTLWNTSLIILAFRGTRVAVRFVNATLSNILINPSVIPTYSYAVSIIGVLYKFMIDIQSPYIKLKNMIAKERTSFTKKVICTIDNKIRNSYLSEIKSDMAVGVNRSFLMPLKYTTFIKISEMVYLPQITRRTFRFMLLTIFVLCVFFLAAKSHDDKFFSRSGNSLIALVAGTVMPLIPRLMTYFGDEDPMDSTIFNERLKNALKVLERSVENRTTEKFDWSVPSTFVPFKFTILSIVNEPKEQSDEGCDVDESDVS